MKLLVAGDTHGDPQHTIYLFEQALMNGCADIFQVGDFGYWEHLEGGRAYLDVVSALCTENDMRLYWIDGNHENHTMLRAKYGPDGPEYKPTPEGFWEIRPGVYYVPRGTRWNWNGVEIMGLGGAYSVDKQYRLAREQGRTCPEWGWFNAREPMGERTMWWPEEEITDEEVNYALRDQRPIDILFCHDKPRASNPDWNRKDLPECWPNQDRIQTVIRSLTPELVVHGHLHHHYADTIRVADDKECTVIGLDCEPNEKKDPKDSYIVLDLAK